MGELAQRNQQRESRCSQYIEQALKEQAGLEGGRWVLSGASEEVERVTSRENFRDEHELETSRNKATESQIYSKCGKNMSKRQQKFKNDGLYRCP